MHKRYHISSYRYGYMLGVAYVIKNNCFIEAIHEMVFKTHCLSTVIFSSSASDFNDEALMAMLVRKTSEVVEIMYT